MCSAGSRAILRRSKWAKDLIDEEPKSIFDVGGGLTPRDRNGECEWDWTALPPIELHNNVRLYVCTTTGEAKLGLKAIALDRKFRYPESVESLRLDAVSEMVSAVPVCQCASVLEQGKLEQGKAGEVGMDANQIKCNTIQWIYITTEAQISQRWKK